MYLDPPLKWDLSNDDEFELFQMSLTLQTLNPYGVKSHCQIDSLYNTSKNKSQVLKFSGWIAKPVPKSSDMDVVFEVSIERPTKYDCLYQELEFFKEKNLFKKDLAAFDHHKQLDKIITKINKVVIAGVKAMILEDE